MSTLLKLQIGPVQEFIAQARSTRDLWSGSYLLSWLMAAALRKLAERVGGAEAARTAVIYPALQDQPLLDFLIHGSASRISLPECLTPNFPNLFVARLQMEPDQATLLAQEIAEMIRQEWHTITEVCWQKLVDPDEGVVDADLKPRFDRQVNRFLSITWQVTPGAEDYVKAYRLNGWQLDAVRQTREFHGWGSGGWQTGKRNNKDSLSGREEAICGGTEWWEKCIRPWHDQNPNGFWPTAFRQRQAGDIYGAISLVKRLWHRVYLSGEPWRISVAEHLSIPSTWQVARHDFDKNEEDESRTPSATASGYFAVLAMDGDEMGKWLSGQKAISLDADRHRQFSAQLSEFALKQVGKVVRRHDGCLIYAGGDDVLALLPADTALACALELRNTFREVLKQDIDASVGIAIAHFKEPLQDVVRAAQDAERRAKNKGNRATLAISLFKRSGETVFWHCKWPSAGKAQSGLGLFETVRTGLAAKQLSAKFPHRVAELLSPYLLDPAEEGKHLYRPVNGFNVREIAEREFEHALRRQHGAKWKKEFHDESIAHLAGYLDQLDGFRDANEAPLEANDKIRCLIGLCQTVAFVNRNPAASPPPAAAAPPRFHAQP